MTQDVSRNIALIGNPNTGKSTLFNALSGVRQRVGNYPGVTVEKKIGKLDIDGTTHTLIDLPGTYSLAPRSPDEMIAVDVLLGRQTDVGEPDVVLCIVDASNLERNLYLLCQVLELERPTVLALNMVDVAREKGLSIDVELLRSQLGIPVVEIQANQKRGIDDLKQAVEQLTTKQAPSFASPFSSEFQDEVSKLSQLINGDASKSLPRYLIERLLLDTSGYLADAGLPGIDDRVLSEVAEARERLAAAGQQVPAVEAMVRYAWVHQILNGVIERPKEKPSSSSDRLDKFLTHRVWGSLVFLLLMGGMFQAVFLMAEPASVLIDSLMESLTSIVDAVVEEGTLHSLLVDGVISGVGGVLIFLPQIFTLFLFIAVLEDCGYMSRAAYLMDKLMSRVGLSGKSFIPLLSSFACAIPGIMAARVIENRKDRLATMVVAPLMSCSARLPVYVLLTRAFIPDTTWAGGLLSLRGLVIFAMYLLGIVVAVLVALILKKTLLRGTTPPFVMELPSYKIPALGNVLHRMFDRGWAFVRRAGTLILAVTVVVWAAGYFPRSEDQIPQDKLQLQSELATQVQELSDQLARASANDEIQQQLDEANDALTEVENEISGIYLQKSYLGQIGLFIEPVVKPLGWDWRIGCATVASFPAREVIVATLGVIYNLGSEVDEESDELIAAMKMSTWDAAEDERKGKAVFNVPVALSIMVFFALCAQCASTLAVMKRETNSWRWPIFTFVYMTAIAYIGAFLTYQIGMLFVS